MTSRGRREENKARTRDAILVAAIELMDRQDFRSTTMAEIARAAGVSTATVFNYFPTKASILFGDNHMWRPPTLEAPGADIRETILLLLQGMLDQPGWTRPVDDPLAVTRFRLVQQDPDLRREQLTLAMLQVPTFAEALHELHPDVPLETCLTLAGSVIGAIISATTFIETTDVRQALVNAARMAAANFSL